MGILRELRSQKWKNSALRHLPDVMPSLGLLHQFGLRVQRRLEIAQAIAREHPDWLARRMGDNLFTDVMSYVYHWFPSSSSGVSDSAKEPAKEMTFVTIDADGAQHST